VGIDLAALGEILGDGEDVLRGLNPKHCQDGLPTEGCFILKAYDTEGPSFGILVAAPEAHNTAPLGVRQGISPELFSTLLPSPDYGVARLNVGRALQEVRGRGVVFARIDDEDWGEHRTAHAMLIGYQALEPRARKDLQRFLARLANEAVLKRAAPKPT
jgi:hypothetical protein